MVQRIALCGAPLTGKTTLLAALGRRMGTEQILRSFGATENLSRVDIRYQGKQAALITVSGTFHHTSSTVLPTILSGVRAVVYVCAARATVHAPGSAEHHDREEAHRQHFFWDVYTREAEKVGSSWRSIPWIIVLNKIDLGRRNPLSEHIPESLQTDLLSCSATHGEGVAQLCKKVISLLE
jgi:Fe2+ transport system protein B